MKRISIFLMLAILVWSCSKDDTNSISESQVQTRQSVDYQIDNFDPPRNYEDLRECYNQFVRDGVETFNEKFGEEVNKRITYESDGNVSQVIPLFKGEVMENILWINEEYYFLLNKSEEKDSEGNPVRSYSRIFRLSKTEFLTGNLSLLDQNYLIENSENELRLTEIQKTITPDEVYGKPYSPCSHWEDEWLLVYYDFFGLIPPNVGEPPLDVIEFETMNEIINSVTGGACVCPIPCLVIQSLNEHPDVMQTAADLANRNWVMYEYGLDQFTLDNMESELLNELVEFNCNPTNIIDACNGNPINQSEIIDAILNSDGTLFGFRDVLTQEYNWLNLQGFNSSSDDCSSEMNCILQKHLSTTLCQETFSVFNNLNELGNFGLTIVYDLKGNAERKYNKVDIGYLYEFPNNPNIPPYSWSGSDSDQADTFLDNYGSNNFGSFIVLNKFLCRDKNALEIASVIQHELLHTRLLALVYDEMVNLGFDPTNDVDFSIGGMYWDLAMQMLIDSDPSVTTPHQVMYDLLMADMVDNLMLMNNDTDPSNREKYEYLVLSGLAPDFAPAPLPDLVRTGMITWDINDNGICDQGEDLNGDGNCDDSDSYLELARLKSLSEELSNPDSNLDTECGD